MLKKIGIILLVIGGLSLFLESSENIPNIVCWIYNWGENISWEIRIGILALGGFCLFWSSLPPKHNETEEQ